MPVEIPADLPPELVPFSWLLGEWEGHGFLGYGEASQRPFRQRLQVAHHGLPFLEHRAQYHTVDEDGRAAELITMEHGFWQLDRRLGAQDPGPGLLPGAGAGLGSADEVEALRTADGGFPVVATITRPGGVCELYVGEIAGPRIQLGTDAVVRSQGAKALAASTRMLGLVNGDLFWAWDMAADGRPLGSHASAELTRVS